MELSTSLKCTEQPSFLGCCLATPGTFINIVPGETTGLSQLGSCLCVCDVPRTLLPTHACPWLSKEERHEINFPFAFYTFCFPTGEVLGQGWKGGCEGFQQESSSSLCVSPKAQGSVIYGLAQTCFKPIYKYTQ